MVLFVRIQSVKILCAQERSNYNCLFYIQMSCHTKKKKKTIEILTLTKSTRYLPTLFDKTGVWYKNCSLTEVWFSCFFNKPKKICCTYFWWWQWILIRIGFPVPLSLPHCFICLYYTYISRTSTINSMDPICFNLIISSQD